MESSTLIETAPRRVNCHRRIRLVRAQRSITHMSTNRSGRGIISRLHLPVSNFVSFLAVILPVGNLVAVAHALVQSSGHASPLKHVRWNLFATLLTILDAVLVTLAATNLDAESLACPLQGNWSKMFQAKDGKHIQQIQDALNCCGFKTVKDMPFPFPHGKDQLMQCADTNNR